MASTNTRTVVAGPAKFDLMLALFDRKMVNGRKVVFGVTNSSPGKQDAAVDLEYDVSVTSVEAENGGGESWNIQGYATIRPKDGEWKDSSPVPSPHRRVLIYFRTDKRKGHIKFLD